MKIKRLMILFSAVLSLTMFFSINSVNARIYPYESTTTQKSFEQLNHCLFEIKGTVYLFKEGNEKVKKVVDLGKGADHIAFSPDGNYIAYSMIDSGKLNVYAYDIASKTSREVIDDAVGNSVVNLEWINNQTIISELHINPSTSSFNVCNIETNEVKSYLSSNFQSTSDGKHVIYIENRPHFGENLAPYKLLIDDQVVYQSEDLNCEISATVISSNSNKVAFVEENDNVARLVIAIADFDAKNLKINRKIEINKDIAGTIYFEGDDLYILSEDCMYQVDEQNATLIRKNIKKDTYSAKETDKIAGLKNAVLSMYKIVMSEITIDDTSDLISKALSKARWTNSKAVIDNYAETESTIKVVYQSDEIEFDQPPVINDGRVLVPMRKVFEALNAKVLWDDTSRTITAETDNKKIVLTIDKPAVQIDSDTRGIKSSETIALDVPAKIIGGRTMVPVRFISESLGKKVLWDTPKKTVYIDEIFDTEYKKVILNNYKHAVKKFQGRDITVYYENSDALGLSKTIGINVEEEIFKLCGSDDYFIQAPSKACFSSGDKSDLLVNVSVDNFDFEKQLFLVFTKNQGKYVLQFYNYACEGKSNKSSYNLIDIDSDGKNEILLETSFTGMGNGGSNAVILKYHQQKVERIFDEGLSFNSNSSLFPYENTFRFIRNPLNSNLYDISFKVNIRFDQDIYKAILERGSDIAVPVEDRKDLSEDYIYKFDGKNYISDKKVVDYQCYYMS